MSKIEGTSGNDTLSGSAGDDEIIGYGGDDTLYSGGGNDSLDGGDGNDLIQVDGGTATVSGGDGNDTVSLTNSSTVGATSLSGGAGSDLLQLGWNVTLTGSSFSAASSGFEQLQNLPPNKISGDGGDNAFDFSGFTLVGSFGINLLGLDGNDTLTGTALNDTLQGGNGNDTLIGGDGDDELIGDDWSWGNPADDVLIGGNGNDTLFGVNGTNILDGGAGNDMLYGGADNDTILGGDGNDTIVDYSGVDTINGGAGDDQLSGSKTATAVFADALADCTLTRNADNTITVKTLTEGTDTLSGFATLRFSDQDVAAWIVGYNVITGGDGDDTLTGGDGDDAISGGAGNDVLNGGGGSDIVTGGAGNDLLVGSATSTAVFADYSGQCTILRNPDNTITVMTATEGTDTLSGFGTLRFANQDVATSTITCNVVTGTTGDDTFTYAVTDANATDRTFVLGDAGNDTLVLDLSKLATTMSTVWWAGTNLGLDVGTYTQGSLSAAIIGLDANGQFVGEYGPQLRFTGIENLTITGSAYSDNIWWGRGSNTFLAGAGDDTFNVEATGNNVFDGGDGTDTLNYQNSQMAGGGISVSLAITGAQSVGNGTITISNVENLTATWGNDTLIGNDSNNVLNGLGGNDTLIGGGGTNILDGGDGIDTVDYSGQTVGGAIDLGSGRATIGFNASDTLINIENVIGTPYGDGISGNERDNILMGGAGDDFLGGNAGNDTLIGGTGTDTMMGGPGNDVMYGSETSVVMLSNALADCTVKRNADGGITVTSPIEGTDTLYGFATLRFTDQDVATSSITGTATNVINGTNGDDTLVGTNADDIVNGGAGNDTLIGGGGTNILDGGDGIDTVDYSGQPVGGAIDLGSGRATIGFNASDTLINIENVIGTPYGDGISGNERDNILMGGDGNDFLGGNDGNDTLYGGTGTDTMMGGPGNDVMFGSETSVVMFSNALSECTVKRNLDGSITVTSPIEGTDTLYGFATLRFTDQDVATTSLTSNLISGTPGDDTISYAVTDQNAGKDMAIDGQAGNDTLVLDLSQLTTTMSEVWWAATYLQPSPIDNTAQVLSAYELGLDANGQHVDQFNPSLTLTNVENLTVIGSIQSDNIWWLQGNTTFTGGAGDDYFGAEAAGNNVFDGGDGRDTLSYDSTQFAGGVRVNLAITTPQRVGDGTITIANVEDLIGSAGNDTLIGSSIGNQLNGLAGDDVIRGGGGDDVLIGDVGNDSLNGGGGKDVAIFSGNLADYTITANADGSTTVSGWDGIDTLTNIEILWFDDATIGLDKNDTISWAINDTTVRFPMFIDGGAGNDTVVLDCSQFGTTMTEVWWAATYLGPDPTNTTAVLSADETGLDRNGQYVGYFDPTVTMTNVENLTFTGSNFSDNIWWLHGDNTITGGAGDDLFAGEATGKNVFDGGDGTDTLSYEYALFAGGIKLNLAVSKAQTVGDGRITIANVENLTGSAGDDTLTGSTGNNVLNGLTGNDVLVAGDGIDAIYGGVGDDSIDMDGYLTTADTIDGGDGSDTVVLDGDYSGTNAVTMTATTVVNVENLTLQGRHSYILTTSDATVAAGQILTVNGADLKAGDVLVFDGSAETDGRFVITGGRGADDLAGGALSDTFTFTSAAQSTSTSYDTIRGFDFSVDHFTVPDTITGVDSAVTSGALDAGANFDRELRTALSGHLQANHAVLFTPNSGGLAGQTFMVVDCNGTAGYQSGHDLVVRLVGQSGALAAGSFG